MNKNQSNKLNSFRKVKGVLLKKAGLFRDVPVYEEPLDQYFGYMDEIEEVAKRTELDTKGETKRKNDLKMALSELTVSLASSGLLYAYANGNTEFESALDYTMSDLYNGRDNDTLKIALAVEEELTGHQEALVDYQVSAEDLARLHELIYQFRDAREIQGDVKSTSVADTRRLGVLIGLLDELLNRKIDRIVERMKMDNRRFYDTYRSARVIVDL